MANNRIHNRTEKQKLRWQKHLDRQRELRKQIRSEAYDILCSERFISTKRYIQHGNMTVNSHCMNVAKYSLAFSDKLHIRC